MPANEIAMKWAPRVKQARIRRLYRFAGLGVYDEDALDDVGTSLYARIVDIATVADAFQNGRVACPRCQTRVQRRIDPLYGMGWHGDRGRWFHCPHCSSRLLWTECRKALREKPRCFDCRTLLKGKNPLRCNCGTKWDPRAYHRSIGSRVRLPCPSCRGLIRKPEGSGRKRRNRQSNDERLLCPGCQGKARHTGGEIRCEDCGYRRRWRDYRKGLKRRDERLECEGCGHVFTWQAWRKSAKPLTTGNPQPARDFVRLWPTCRTPEQRMLQIDLLLQTLHGRGPLAPLFIEGDERRIRALLDELASQVPAHGKPERSLVAEQVR